LLSLDIDQDRVLTTPIAPLTQADIRCDTDFADERSDGVEGNVSGLTLQRHTRFRRNSSGRFLDRFRRFLFD